MMRFKEAWLARRLMKLFQISYRHADKQEMKFR
jgi:hypothetical protein